MLRWLPVLAVCLVLASQPALALTDEEVFRDFRFNLINPGARSMGMGGAFVSLANDATAAQANPAGLSFLQSPEYFVELRAVDNAARSSIRTEVLPAQGETFVATGTDIDDTIGPTFVSAVTTYGRWTMGLSLQELIRINNATVSSFAFTFPQSPGAFLAEGTGSIDVDVRNVNVSVGGRITDRLALGGTLTYSRLDVNSEVVNMIVDTGGNVAGQEILEPTLDLRTSIDDSDFDVTYSLGLIYKHLNKNQENRWNIGAVYRRAPRFTVTQVIEAEGIDVDDVRDRLGTRFLNRFNLPDVIGVGASGSPIEPLTLSLDIERILYSNLMDSYVAGVNILTSEDAEFTIDDGTDYRLGAEYLLRSKSKSLQAFAVRGGVYTKEPATIRALDTGSGSFASEDVFGGRDRELHGALGLGLIFKRYKLDFAIDLSEPVNEYLISFIYQGK